MAISTPSFLEFEVFNIITPTATVEIEPSSVAELNIFESLMSPGITGYFILEDYQGAKELGEISSGDKVEISFKSDNESSMNLQLAVYASYGDEVFEQAYGNFTKIHFCSEWLIPAFTRQVSKVFKDKTVEDIVKDFVEVECGGKMGIVEPVLDTFKQELFVSPLWTPIHTIKYFMGFIQNQEGQGGYLLWTDSKTGLTNFTTYNFLLKMNYGRANVDFVLRPLNPRYAGKVENMKIETNFDLIKFMNLGIHNTKVYGFDYDRKQFIETDCNIKEYNHQHLSSKIPIQEAYLDDKYTTVKFSSLYPSEKALISDEKKPKDYIEGYLYSNYSNLMGDLFKINVQVHGSTQRRAGFKVKLDYPSMKESKTQPHKQFNGDYIIRDIRHTINGSIYKQFITLISDGYKEISRGDLISW